LRQEREKAKRAVYDESVSDPYGQLLSSVREALELVGDPLPKGDEQGDGLSKLQV
jgi:hypothetical protein